MKERWQTSSLLVYQRSLKPRPKDFLRIYVTELVNALLAQEWKRAIRSKDFVENAVVVRTKGLKVKGGGSKKLEGKGNKTNESK